MGQWSGKTVWITGASSGIGRSLTIKLAKQGATVVISARREKALSEVAQRDPQLILPVAMDVTEHQAIPHFQQQLANRVESIDVAIFAAGVVEYEDDLSFDPQRYQRVFATNFFGLVNSVAIAMPLLEKSQHQPYIVGITSLAAFIGLPRAEAYGSSKAAADYFLQSLRADLDPGKFAVSIVRPGFVETPMTSVNDFPMPFLMNSAAAADRIIHGMNKRELFINFPTRLSLILKLLACLPSLWYGRLAPKMSRHKPQK